MLYLLQYDGSNPRYAIYKSKISWAQARDNPTGAWPATGQWVADCSECYFNQLVRDYVEDMEFIALDREGRRLLPSQARHLLMLEIIYIR